MRGSLRREPSAPGFRPAGILTESTISRFGASTYGPFLLAALECPEHLQEAYEAFFQVFGSASALHSSDSSHNGSKLGPSRLQSCRQTLPRHQPAARGRSRGGGRERTVGLRAIGFFRH